jgi:hypothetical protein
MRAALYARKESCPVSVRTAYGSKKPILGNSGLGGDGFAPQVSCALLVICLLAGSGSVWLFETSSAIAKQRSTVVQKDKKSSLVKKEKSIAARKKQKSFAAKNRKSVVSAKKEARIIPEVRTPVDKHDCIAAAQVFYGKAQTLAGQMRQTIPQEFHRVVSKLDEFCGEEEFEKARISIDWMNLCLENLTGDRRAEFCSNNKSYFCAIDPKASACITSEARAND